MRRDDRQFGGDGAETGQRVRDAGALPGAATASLGPECDGLEALSQFDGRLEDINVGTHLAKELPLVMADPEAIKRVIANLVDNSAEAMSDAMVRDLVIATEVLGGRDTVELSVSDTGPGVPAAAKEKLFMPYFSTKQRGTGLGLAIVARIIEDHHGTIRVEENRPMGARFVIELPVAVEVEPGPAMVEGTVS